MCRRSSNPQPPNPIWKEICPCKSSVSILTLSISCSVDFKLLARDFNLNPELLLWRAGFVFSTIDFCRYFLLRRRGCDFCKIWFWYPSLCRFHRPFFLRLSFQHLGVRFPNSGFVSNSNFCNFVSGLTVFLFNKAFWDLFPSVPSFRCCEGFVELFCWYELSMNLRANIHKVKLCQKFDTQALQHSCSNVWLKECMLISWTYWCQRD